MCLTEFYRRTATPMLRLSTDWSICDINQACRNLIENADEIFSGKRFLEFLTAEDQKNLQDWRFASSLQGGEQHLSIATYLHLPDGGPQPAHISLYRGDKADVLVVLDRRRINLETTKSQPLVSPHDPVTGLVNRTILHDRMEHALYRCERDHSTFALLIIGLRRFREFNYTYGHRNGDRLLQKVAERLTSCVRKSDTIARYGGARFAILLEGLQNKTTVPKLVNKVLDVMAPAFHLNGYETFLTTHIGISLFPEDGNNVETLTKHAETAMHYAREEGRRRYRFFSHEMEITAPRRLQLKNALQKAQLRGEFEIYYQPQLEMEQGLVTGVEALLRWDVPGVGLVGPDDFIPILEETGQIVPIGYWVLQQACKQVEEWRRVYHLPRLHLAVNISPSQVIEEDFIPTLQQILKITALPPEFLELEITENCLVKDRCKVTLILQSLAALGVRIVIDDFGTGYSSLAYLKHFPVHGVKLDRSFVQGIPENREDKAITFATLALAKNLGLQVTAEGVEYSHQYHFFNETRYENMRLQGFLIAHPMPARDFGRWHNFNLPQLLQQMQTQLSLSC